MMQSVAQETIQEEPEEDSDSYSLSDQQNGQDLVKRSGAISARDIVCDLKSQNLTRIRRLTTNLAQHFKDEESKEEETDGDLP